MTFSSARLPSLIIFGVLLTACNDVAGPLTARGTVEVRSVDVSPLVSGRLTSVLVDEGSSVRVGDTLATLTAPTIRADLDAAEAWVRVAEAQLRDLDAGSRPQEIQRAETEVAAAEIEAERLEVDYQRAKSLWESGAVARREYERAEGAAGVAEQRLQGSREMLALLQDGARVGQIATARAELARARASLAARTASNDEYVLVAPIDGVVLSRIAEPGDLLAVGRPVLELGQVAEPWVRVYVPAWALPSLAVGDDVVIEPPRAGAAGGSSERSTPTPGDWSGRIVAINPRAEFITRTALTEDERADQLFGVKVAIADTTGAPKPGLPVTVIFPELVASQ